MNTNEVNEFLAERLDGKKIQPQYKWDRKQDCYIDHLGNREYIPNYIKHYQPVLEKLLETQWLNIRIGKSVNDKFICELYNSQTGETLNKDWGFTDTLGEAICNAAVEN